MIAWEQSEDLEEVIVEDALQALAALENSDWGFPAKKGLHNSRQPVVCAMDMFDKNLMVGSSVPYFSR